MKCLEQEQQPTAVTADNDGPDRNIDSAHEDDNRSGVSLVDEELEQVKAAVLNKYGGAEQVCALRHKHRFFI